MPEHSVLTDPELHEPKGASTATANQVYISDGSGSGTWTHWPTGWGRYADTGTGAQVFNTTYSKLVIDNVSIEAHLPQEIRGTDSLWDIVNNKITPITIGDAYNIRIDLPVTAKTGAPDKLEFVLDIGVTTSPTVEIVHGEVLVDKTTPFDLVITFPVYSLNTFKANGGQIFMKTSSDTITIEDPSIIIYRTHAGDI